MGRGGGREGLFGEEQESGRRKAHTRAHKCSGSETTTDVGGGAGDESAGPGC